MIDLMNTVAMALTIAFGLFGFLAPSFTASALDLVPTNSSMGLSEMRASVGGLFVITAGAALVLNTPTAYTMVGFVYAGAALGRFLSLALDKPPFVKAFTFGLIEAALALWLIVANLNRTDI